MESYDNDVKVSDLLSRFERIKNRYAHRDTRMAQVRAIRAGKMSEVAPDLFPDAGPWQEPIVANMIDIAARDVAEMLAPLPSFNCSSPAMGSDKQRERANVRTKVAQGYVTSSDLQVQMYTAADQYVTYGFLPFRIEVDYDSKMPIIRTLDPVGTYPEYDRFGRVSCVYQRVLITRDELVKQFPEYRSQIEKSSGVFGSQEVEIVFYHDKNWDLAFLNGPDPIILEKTPNPIGKCLIHVARRPGASSEPRGQFDDVIFIQLAKSSMALLALQAAHESVNAPIVVPSDVPEVPYGAGATIRTNNPGGVGRLRLDLPQDAFSEQSALERELQLGSRFPEVRTGNTDSSIVTGKGVQALMSGYDSQIRGHQAIFAKTMADVISLCFEVDDKLFSDEKKSMRGSENGAPFQIKYTPGKDIDGDYTVDVKYGLMAGLDPNRWLVFALQARGEKMFSRDFMRREMPIDIDVEDETRKIDIEDLEEATKQAILSYSQSIPMIATQGGDIQKPLEVLSKLISDRRKGKDFVESVQEAFAPEEPEQPTEEEQAQATFSQAVGGQARSEAVPQQQSPAPQGEGGAPDIATLLAGLNSSGEPNLSANVRRQQEI